MFTPTQVQGFKWHTHTKTHTHTHADATEQVSGHSESAALNKRERL